MFLYLFWWHVLCFVDMYDSVPCLSSNVTLLHVLVLIQQLYWCNLVFIMYTTLQLTSLVFTTLENICALLVFVELCEIPYKNQICIIGHWVIWPYTKLNIQFICSVCAYCWRNNVNPHILCVIKILVMFVCLHAQLTVSKTRYFT